MPLRAGGLAERLRAGKEKSGNQKHRGASNTWKAHTMSPSVYAHL